MIVSFDPLDVDSKKKYVDAGKEKGIDVKELKEGLHVIVYAWREFGADVVGSAQ